MNIVNTWPPRPAAIVEIARDIANRWQYTITRDGETIAQEFGFATERAARNAADFELKRAGYRRYEGFDDPMPVDTRSGYIQ